MFKLCTYRTSQYFLSYVSPCPPIPNVKSFSYILLQHKITANYFSITVNPLNAEFIRSEIHVHVLGEVAFSLTQYTAIIWAICFNCQNFRDNRRGARDTRRLNETAATAQYDSRREQRILPDGGGYQDSQEHLGGVTRAQFVFHARRSFQRPKLSESTFLRCNDGLTLPARRSQWPVRKIFTRRMKQFACRMRRLIGLTKR